VCATATETQGAAATETQGSAATETQGAAATETQGAAATETQGAAVTEAGTAHRERLPPWCSLPHRPPRGAGRVRAYHLVGNRQGSRLPSKAYTRVSSSRRSLSIYLSLPLPLSPSLLSHTHPGQFFLDGGSLSLTHTDTSTHTDKRAPSSRGRRARSRTRCAAAAAPPRAATAPPAVEEEARRH
jgi:hypothetical protein